MPWKQPQCVVHVRMYKSKQLVNLHCIHERPSSRSSINATQRALKLANSIAFVVAVVAVVVSNWANEYQVTHWLANISLQLIETQLR